MSMRTLEEIERAAYISGNPAAPTLAALTDAEAEVDRLRAALVSAIDTLEDISHVDSQGARARWLQAVDWIEENALLVAEVRDWRTR